MTSPPSRCDPTSTLAHPLLSVRGLRRPGLAPTNLVVGAGQCVVISGASGSGKTLLLRTSADLDPDEGDVRPNGRPRDAFAAPDWRRQRAQAAAESGWWPDRVGDHFTGTGNVAALLPGLGLPEDALGWPVARLSSGKRSVGASSRST
jgi:ABC-type uncharacterized transport system, ATPase component